MGGQHEAGAPGRRHISSSHPPPAQRHSTYCIYIWRSPHTTPPPLRLTHTCSPSSSSLTSSPRAACRKRGGYRLCHLCRDQPEEKMAAPVLRAASRVRGQVRLLPRIIITATRCESGGKGAENTGVSKTLVSFPVKLSNFHESTTGENLDDLAKHELKPRLDVGSCVDIGQDMKSADQEPQEEDSSSSSSSDSESDSDEEGKDSQEVETAGSQKLTGPSGETKASSDVQNTHLEKAEAQEGKEREILKVPISRKENGEDLVDLSPAEDAQNQMHAKSQPEKMSDILTGQEKGEDLMDPAPALDRQENSSYAQEQPKITGDLSTQGKCEDLVDVAPEVKTQEPLGRSHLEDIAPNDDLTLQDKSEVLPDIAPVVDSEEQVLTLQDKSKVLLDIAPVVDSEEQVLTLQDKSEVLLDIAPVVDLEEQAQSSEAVGQGEEETVAAHKLEEVSAPEDLEPSDGLSLPSADTEEETTAAAALSPPPPAPPAPEEPCDNSTYQNEQHYSYTPFTFVDYDVDLSKFRLPQPSSGRPSPRH